jgi:hypothetical protein
MWILEPTLLELESLQASYFWDFSHEYMFYYHSLLQRRRTHWQAVKRHHAANG